MKRSKYKLFLFFILCFFVIWSVLKYKKSNSAGVISENAAGAESTSDAGGGAEAAHSSVSEHGAKNAAGSKTHDAVLKFSDQDPLVTCCAPCPGHEIHTYSGFTLCYREEYEQAEWVAYELTESELVKTVERSNYFRADPSISTNSASPEDYVGSGYDKGHLAPAGDMAWSEQSMRDSFFMSNMSPQLPSFNRGIWKYLEDQVRLWAKKFGWVYVISGPVLEKPAGEYKSIGKNKVSVPEYYYKALLTKTADGKIYVLAFILPNQKYTGSFYDFAVTVDEVERRTSLDFFAALEDDVENALESAVDISVWK
ncbi:DNA/RNA non-specific endonuclease [Treponema parvum]|uniref:DNA/RNA non-specific endonuclease n=1 Tax=Treponema parvum TaxID=138851 RepID=UPI001AEC2D22|nr:DNA/RNA non-specific endonuclease [Treponema parvum]QTQ16792.1 DNA/RNA non-specific endonuclease [Treponema parvum]